MAPVAPAARHSTESFIASDGVSLFAQRWVPAQIKGHVILIHGYGEHSSRYAHVADRLNAEGYAVYTYDQRGHGQSPGRMGRIESFDRLIEDANEFTGKILSEAGPEPRFIFGHSMGGLVVSAFVLRFAPDVRGLVLTNPAVKADDNTSPFLRKIAKWAARFAPGMKAHALDINGLSRVPEVVKAYASDPLVHHGYIDARTGYEMMKTIEFVQANLKKLQLPFLTVHGTADRLVPSRAAELLYEQASSRDKSIHLYDGGYHELFNDLTADRFFDDLLDWLRART
jgi:alpha-beta hydrolase superfamily lysophospholipase